MTGLKTTVLTDAIWGRLCKPKVSEHDAWDMAKMLAALDLSGQHEEARGRLGEAGVHHFYGRVSASNSPAFHVADVH